MYEGKYSGDFIFYCKWMKISDDYELKILMMASYLAENDGKCKQTLANMCRWMGVKPSSPTRNKIKEALERLSEQNYLVYETVGNYWIIELVIDDKEWGVFSFKRRWLDLIKNANHNFDGKIADKSLSISWVKVAKVFVYQHMVLEDNEVRTLEECASDLNMSKELFSKTYKILEQIDFQDVSIGKKTKRIVDVTADNGRPILFRTIGSRFVIQSPYAENYGSLNSPYRKKLKAERLETEEELPF